MGQHKYNQVAIAAKNGDLPDKKRSVSKSETKRMLYKKCEELLCRPFVDKDGNMQIGNYYGIK